MALTRSKTLPQNSRQVFEICILTYRKNCWFSEPEIWAQVAPIWRGEKTEICPLMGCDAEWNGSSVPVSWTSGPL